MLSNKGCSVLARVPHESITWTEENKHHQHLATITVILTLTSGLHSRHKMKEGLNVLTSSTETGSTTRLREERETNEFNTFM